MRFDLWPPMSNSPSLPVSATEWTASASIAPDPVTAKPTNFMIAMPRLAANAATTAVVECSSADIERHARRTSAGGDERVEQPLLHGIITGGRFGMPLHGYDPALGQFESFEHAVVDHAVAVAFGASSSIA